MTPTDTTSGERYAAFRHGAFLRFWVARFLATFSTQIVSVAVGWQIYDLTRDPFDLGLVGIIQFLPSLLLVLVTGVIADRFGRRLIMGLSALLEAAFIRAAQQADAIITSGGVSVGEADHTKAMMKKLGDVAFWKIAMRPGRPMAVGRIAAGDRRGTVLFGLPGNPVAVMVTFLAFVRPALLRMMGCRSELAPLLKARSREPIRKKPGRTEYQRGVVRSAADGSLEVATTGNQGSGVLSSMVQGNGLIVLHHDQGSVAIGDEVDVMMFDGVI